MKVSGANDVRGGCYKFFGSDLGKVNTHTHKEPKSTKRSLVLNMKFKIPRITRCVDFSKTFGPISMRCGFLGIFIYLFTIMSVSRAWVEEGQQGRPQA